MKKQTLVAPKTPLFKSAINLIVYLRTCGFHAWIVGGASRDLLLGSIVKDVDIATDAKPEDLLQLFNQTYCVGVHFGVVIVVFEGYSFEVATMRTESGTQDGRHPDSLCYTQDPALDAKRRDFTINALYFDPLLEEVTDYFTGFEDLKNKKIRTVGQPVERLNEDFLRMMRAVRFAAQLGFEMEDSLERVIVQLSSSITRLSPERLRSEMTCCLLSGRPRFALEKLFELELLSKILPEVVALRDCTQDKLYHPEGDVFTHTCLALEAINKKDEQLAWSVLLHDICKPKTRSVDEKGQIHFYLHEYEGRFESERILMRFKFDRASINVISASVADHMRFFNVKQMKHAKLRRLMATPHFFTTLELIRCDAMGCHGDLEPYHTLCELFNVFSNTPLIPAPLLTGRDLIAMGLTPSPRFKELLSELIDAQMEGSVMTRSDAKNFIKQCQKINFN